MRDIDRYPLDEIDEFLERHHETLHGESPLAAERLATGLCADWYRLATWDWKRSHPLGQCPTTLPLWRIATQADHLHDVDAALTLTRCLGALFEFHPDPYDVALRTQQRLIERGARAAEWSGVLEMWTPVSAIRFALTDGCDPAPDGQLATVATFEHECGERHCLAVTTCPIDDGAVCRIHEFSDATAAEALLAARKSFPFLDWPRTSRPIDVRRAGTDLWRSVRHTYKDEFSRLQSDQPSCALFAMLWGRLTAFEQLDRQSDQGPPVCKAPARHG